MGVNPDWKGSLDAIAMEVADDDDAGGGGGAAVGGTGVDEPPPLPPPVPKLVSEAISLLASFRTSDKLVVFPSALPLLLLLC